MPTTEQTARPDLSSLDLDWDTRANIVLAEVVDGATWERQDGRWWLIPPKYCGQVFTLRDGKPPLDHGLTDYLNDPAAAWSLMVRETSGVKFDSPDAVGLLWRVHRDDALILDEIPVPIIAGRDRAARRAVVLTSLHKHADGPFADLIRPLLEEVGHG